MEDLDKLKIALGESLRRIGEIEKKLSNHNTLLSYLLDELGVEDAKGNKKTLRKHILTFKEREDEEETNEVA
jgi:hypothetical protein